MGLMEDMMDANYGFGWLLLTLAFGSMFLLSVSQTLESIGGFVLVSALALSTLGTAWITFNVASKQLEEDGVIVNARRVVYAVASAVVVVLCIIGLDANWQHYGDEPWADIMFIGMLAVLLVLSAVSAVQNTARVFERPE